MRLRPRFSYVQAHVSALTLIELARVYVALSDTGGARAVLREVNDILRMRPALGILPARAAELQAKLEAMQNVTVGASSLTTAELRLVPHLATHLTFPEIGTRLHISRHTVKTQAISIYQKLGVSSRSEAIERMREHRAARARERRPGVHAVGMMHRRPVRVPMEMAVADL